MKKFSFFAPIQYAFSSLGKTYIYWAIYITFIVYGLMIISYDPTWKLFGIYDYIANLTNNLVGSTNGMMFIIIGIPFLVTVLHTLSNFLEQNSVVLKLNSRFRIWQMHAFSAMLISLLLSCFLLIISLLIGWGLSGSFENTWKNIEGVLYQLLPEKELYSQTLPNIETAKILFIIFITKFLAFLQVSFLFLLIKIWLKNSAFIMIILIGLAIINLVLCPNLYIFVHPGTLTLWDWVYPSLVIRKCIFLSISTIILYGLTGLLYEKKDFIK
jgi:hypothetical protein